MSPAFRIGGLRGTLVFGLVLLLLGVLMARRAAVFTERSVSTSGTVVYTTRSRLGVKVSEPDGRWEIVSVARPPFSLPGSYMMGDSLAIRVDPTISGEPILPFGSAFFPLRARVDARFRIWLPSLLATGLGALFVGLYWLSTFYPRRFHVGTFFQWGDGSRERRP